MNELKFIKIQPNEYTHQFIFDSYHPIKEYQHIMIFQANQIINSINFETKEVILKIMEFPQNLENEIVRYDNYFSKINESKNEHLHKINEAFVVYDIKQLWIVYDKYLNTLEEYMSHPDRRQQAPARIHFIADLADGLQYLYETLHLHHFLMSPSKMILTRALSRGYPLLEITDYGLFDEINGTIVNKIESIDVQYLPPEFEQKGLSSKSDSWAFGMIIFYLMTGQTIYEAIGIDRCTAVNSNFQFSIPYEKVNNPWCEVLMRKLLVPNPTYRLSIREVFNDIFIQQCKQQNHGFGSINDYIMADSRHFDHGSCGYIYKVYKKSDIETGYIKLYAMKIVRYKENKNRNMNENDSTKEFYDIIKGETNILRCCIHPNIVRYIDHFEFENEKTSCKNYCLVMEYCDYIPVNLQLYLDDHFKKFGKGLPLNQIKHFFGQFANGLFYLHYYRDVVHRDLKPDNLLLCKDPYDQNALPILKISDYGFSRQTADVMSTERGSPAYKAPEIYRGEKYNDKCDLYSVGMILYVMNAYYWVFGTNESDLNYYHNNYCQWEFADDVDWDDSVQNLLVNLITYSPESRYGWEQFFNDEFVQSSMRIIPKSEDMEEYSQFDLMSLV